LEPLSFVFWRKLGKQVRPVTTDNAAYFIVDSINVVEGLNLVADLSRSSGLEGATV